MKEQGFHNVRLRVHGEIARIEVDSRDLKILVEHRKEIISGLKKLGYIYVTLDLEGFRSGSMDAVCAAGTKVLQGEISAQEGTKEVVQKIAIYMSE